MSTAQARHAKFILDDTRSSGRYHKARQNHDGRCPTVELWASSICDWRWQSCVLQFTVYVGPGGSFSPSPATQEQPSLYFPRLSSFCSHFLPVALSSLLSMPGLQTFWSSLPIIRSQCSARPAFSDLSQTHFRTLKLPEPVVIMYWVTDHHFTRAVTSKVQTAFGRSTQSRYGTHHQHFFLPLRVWHFWRCLVHRRARETGKSQRRPMTGETQCVCVYQHLIMPLFGWTWGIDVFCSNLRLTLITHSIRTSVTISTTPPAHQTRPPAAQRSLH